MAIRKVIRLKVLTDTGTWCSILGTIAFSPFLKEKGNSLQDIVSFAELGLWPREVLVVTFVVSREPELPVIQFVGIDRVACVPQIVPRAQFVARAWWNSVLLFFSQSMCEKLRSGT
jgi:hypothetical protein